MGSPGMDYSDYKRSFVYYKRLPDMMQRIEALEKQLKQNPQQDS